MDEGLGVLGLSPGASSEEVRRAYLSLVKKHKPDRDPEGFRRVREAYELVSSQVRFREMVEAHAAPTNGAAEDAPELPDNREAREIAASEPNLGSLATYYGRVAELPKKDVKRGAVTIWKEAVAAHPDSVEARAQLYEAYRRGGSLNDAATIALAAYAEGMHPFAHPILAFHARRAPPALIEQAAADPELRHLLPLAHVERGELELAVELTLALFEDLGRGEGMLHPDAAFRVIAAAGSAQRPDLTARLIAAVQRLLDEAPSAARMLTGGLGARWAVLREAERLRGDLPVKVYEGMVAASIPERTEAELDDLRDWAWHHRIESWRLVRRLAKASPTLHGAFAPHLSPVRKERTSFRGGGWSWWLIFFVGMQIFRAGSSLLHTTKSPSYSPPRIERVAPAPVRPETMFPELDEQVVQAPAPSGLAKGAYAGCDDLAAQVDRMELETRNLRASDPRKAEMQALFGLYQSQCLQLPASPPKMERE